MDEPKKKSLRDIMEESMRELNSCSELFEQSQREMSNQMFSRYTQLREAGFNEEQAFQIVLHRGLT